MKRFLAICSLLTAFAFVGGDLAFAGAEKDPPETTGSEV